MILKQINPGWYFCSQADIMKFDRNHPTASMAADARTFNVLCAIANTLDEEIQMVSDVASDHENGRLPVLDLELFFIDNKVEFSFYKKNCSSPYLLMYRSAICPKTKRNSLFQEGLRRLTNMCGGIVNSERVKVMTEFMNMLKISGYDQKYRYTLLTGIMARHKQCEDAILEGARVRFRCKQDIVNMKAERTGKHANTWFLRGNRSNILKVQYTPGRVGGRFR